MSETSAAFVGSIPDVYEKHMGLVYMTPSALEFMSRLSVEPGARVLELACGTGILTRLLVAASRPAIALTATDLNEPMVETAKVLVRDGSIAWQVADALNLPFPGASFDAVVCQYGVMFFSDKVRAAREARRVLRQGGSYVFNVWGSLAENRAALITHDTVAGFFGGDPPTFFTVPFGYHDRAQIEADLRGGGFSSVRMETVDFESRAPSAQSLAMGMTQGTPLAIVIRERGTTPIEAVTAAVAEAIARGYGSGEIRLALRAHVVTAR